MELRGLRERLLGSCPTSGLEEGDRAAKRSHSRGLARSPGSAPRPAANTRAGVQLWLRDSPELLSCWAQGVHLLCAPLSKKLQLKTGVRALREAAGERPLCRQHRALISLLPSPAKGHLPERQPGAAPKRLPEWGEAESPVPALQHWEPREASAAFPHLLHFKTTCFPPCQHPFIPVSFPCCSISPFARQQHRGTQLTQPWESGSGLQPAGSRAACAWVHTCVCVCTYVHAHALTQMVTGRR